MSGKKNIPKSCNEGVAVVTLICMVGLGFPMFAEEEGSSKSDTRLRKQKQEIKLKLLRERAELISENERIAAVHENIMRLYRKLDRLLAAQPEINELRQRLDKLDDRIKKRKEASEEASDD